MTPPVDDVRGGGVRIPDSYDAQRGHPEIVKHGRSGLLVERSDPQALADVILQLLSNRDQRGAMAQVGFERAATLFSWDRIATGVLSKMNDSHTITPQQIVTL
jgi:glycosyltransferase involved in cell wall biosynthesis